MPLFEYVLLALLGSGATGAAPGTTLGADAIVQPNGGAMSTSMPLAQDKKDDTKKIRTMESRTRRGHQHRRHGRHTHKKKTEGEKKGG